MNSQSPERQHSLRTRTFRSLGAMGLLQITRRLISFVVTILLYRLLEAQHFGVFALCEFALSLVVIFQDFGFREVLIQNKTKAYFEKLFHTAWIVRFLLTLIGFLTVQGLAGPAAHALGKPEIVAPLRIFSFMLFIHLIVFPLDVRVHKDIRFERFFYPEVAAQLSSGIIAICFALAGWGYWSLIFAGLGGQMLRYIVLRAHVPHEFSKGFDVSLMSILWKQGALMTVSIILSFLLIQSIHVIVAKFYDLKSVGFFYLAMNWSSFVVVNLLQITTLVLFPAVSEVQDRLARVRQSLHEYTRWAALITAPFNMGLAVLAPVLLPFLVGTKWNSSIPLLQMMCLYNYFRAVMAPNYTVLQSLGRYRTLSLCRFTELVLILTLIYPISRLGGLFAICVLLAFAKGIAWFASLILISKAMEDKMSHLLRLLLPSLLCACVMGGGLWGLQWWLGEHHIPQAVQLLCSLLLGISLYFGLYVKAYPGGRSQINELLEHIKETFKKSPDSMNQSKS